MPTALQTFASAVIDPLSVNVGGSNLSYSDYLRLPDSQRSNDEADVVDLRFTQKVLEWLGFDSGDVIYNRTTSGRSQDRPDFALKLLGSTAFVVEDKSTDEQFDEASVRQLRRYTAGTAGYCLWTNGRTILGLRFDPIGNYRLLVDVRVEGALGSQLTLFDQEANFQVLHLLFHKDRFAAASGLLSSIAISEEDWRNQARPLTDADSLQTFIEASRYVLDKLAIAATARLTTAMIELDEAAGDVRASQEGYSQVVKDLVEGLQGGVPEAQLSQLKESLLGLGPVLADIDMSLIEGLRPTMATSTCTTWSGALARVAAIVSSLRERELLRVDARRIKAAYMVWRERYRVIEDPEGKTEAELEVKRRTAFAEQVSYVFFVRLLLARVLEDKGIMSRLVSDGGFSAWHEFLKQHVTDNTDEVQGDALLSLVYRRVARFYRHYFIQPVFDWFIPDDYLVALLLQRLNMYDFSQVTSDLLGFTYEAFIDRTARNRKGHFLTPPDVVNFILDKAGYAGRQVIGESLLDPACGSGSFLVHAARRLREALVAAAAGHGWDEEQIAREFISQVSQNLVGLEINPFSCYLAELNLFIQVLDDLLILWRSAEPLHIERFAIFNTNSLEMPRHVLFGTTAVITDQGAALDDAAEIKARRASFDFVIANPPYVNRGIALGARAYKDLPFFQMILKGDENTYLLFLRLAAYYAAEHGVVCFICPLNIAGDESTQKAREFFAGLDWTIKNLTRFYSRTVLFPGVLQGVCVIRIDRTANQEADKIEVAGGFSALEAAGSSIQVDRTRVVSNVPNKTTWHKAWLVNADPGVYDLWEFIKGNSTGDLEDLIDGKMKVREGDARSTWAKPLRVPVSGPGTVPLTKGEAIEDWGGWRPEWYLDPTATIPNDISNRTSCLWVQRLVQRVAQLDEPETALFLKEVSGLEMRRPIRGTIIERGKSRPVVADHTVLVMHTLGLGHTDLAYAVFGLVTSAPCNFLFALFSTNPHANYQDILRLPIPAWSGEFERGLADATRQALDAHRKLRQHLAMYGVGRNGWRVSPTMVLRTVQSPTFRLEELVLRGDLILSGSQSRRLATLESSGQLVVNPQLGDQEAEAIRAVLASHGGLVYARDGKDVRLPRPSAARAFLAQMRALDGDRIVLEKATDAAHACLDGLVLKGYAITKPAWVDLVNKGVPWAMS